MSHPEKADNGNNCEFKWGKLTGHGRPWKDVKFYESFTYGGVEYFLYDCVYLHAENEPEHFIGKLVKIWDHPTYKKRVKVVWFFRPIEITNWLRGDTPYKKEIFLASGEGRGLVNINPVEALIRKCNVVCISKDTRNPQPSAEQLETADHIFYRTFDVGELKISKKFENRIAGIEAKYFFNRAPISQTEDNAKLKSVGNLHNVDKIRLGNSAKHSLGQELNLSPPSKIQKFLNTATTVRKPIMSIKDVGKSFGSHVRTSEHEGRVGASHLRTSKHEGKVGGSYVPTSEHDGKVGSSQDFVGQERLISSKKETLPYHKATPELAQEKGAKIDIQNLKMRSPLKGSVRQDGGISRTMDLSKKTREPDRIERRIKEPVKDFLGLNRGISSTVNLSKKVAKISEKEASEPAKEKGIKIDSHAIKVNQMPNAPPDRSKWFKQLPWEERMDDASQNGSLVLLQNLDPSYTSAEIQGMMRSIFEDRCTAKVLQQSTYSSPHNGQALVIFKTREKADMVITELNERCLMLPNGRPLIAQPGPPRVVREKQSKFFGHLTIDKMSLQKQREQRKAVSTSHLTQANTIEYDMAVEWLLLQKQWEAIWEGLYKKHGEELADLKRQLKQL